MEGNKIPVTSGNVLALNWNICSGKWGARFEDIVAVTNHEPHLNTADHDLAVLS